MTSDELIKERDRLGLTQEEMAARLNGTSVHTYRKWEQGQRKVPQWVPSLLIPRELELGPLSFEEIKKLDEQARARGITITQLVGEYIREGIKGMMAIAFIGLTAWQVCHPEEDQLVRRFSRRRDGSEIAVMGEA